MAKDVLLDLRLIPPEHFELYFNLLCSKNYIGLKRGEVGFSPIQVAMINELARRAPKEFIEKIQSEHTELNIQPEYNIKNDEIINKNHVIVSAVLQSIRQAHPNEFEAINRRFSSAKAKRSTLPNTHEMRSR